MADSYKRFGPLFLEFVRMMVSSGLAGAHVQPNPRNNIELRATSCELRANSNWVCLKLAARGSKLLTELREAFRKNGPVAQVARAHP